MEANFEALIGGIGIWQPWIPGALMLDSIFSLFKCDLNVGCCSSELIKNYDSGGQAENLKYFGCISILHMAQVGFTVKGRSFSMHLSRVLDHWGQFSTVVTCRSAPLF